MCFNLIAGYNRKPDKMLWLLIEQAPSHYGYNVVISKLSIISIAFLLLAME